MRGKRITGDSSYPITTSCWRAPFQIRNGYNFTAAHRVEHGVALYERILSSSSLIHALKAFPAVWHARNDSAAAKELITFVHLFETDCTYSPILLVVEVTPTHTAWKNCGVRIHKRYGEIVAVKNWIRQMLSTEGKSDLPHAPLGSASAFGRLYTILLPEPVTPTLAAVIRSPALGS